MGRCPQLGKLTLNLQILKQPKLVIFNMDLKKQHGVIHLQHGGSVELGILEVEHQSVGELENINSFLNRGLFRRVNHCINNRLELVNSFHRLGDFLALGKNHFRILTAAVL